MKTRVSRFRKLSEVLGLAVLAMANLPPLVAQTAAPNSNDDEKTKGKKEEQVIELSPFEVVTEKDNGYAATSSLAGSRLNTSLKDVASAIQVVTPEFLKDTGATDLKQILIYQTNTEASGIGGNFYGGNADDQNLRNARAVNPDNGTRVRGLDTADRTRDFFPTSIPIDTYNMSRMDIQRGSNSILFGLGSPAGIINQSLKDPNLNKLGVEAQFKVDSYGSLRGVLDVNVPLLKDTLGLRVIGLDENEKFRQDFTFEHDKRVYAAARWQPVLSDRVFTQIDVKVESGRINANRPVSVTASDFISNWFGPLNHYLAYQPLTDNGVPIAPDGTRHPELSHYFAGAPARDWWNGSPATIFQNPNASTIGNGHVDAYRQRDGVPWGGLSGVTNVNYDEGGSGSWNKNTAAYFANNSIITQLINQYQTATGKTFSGFGNAQWPTQSILSGPLAFIDRTMAGPNKKEWNNFDTINISATQTYLDGRLGFNAAFDRQKYKYGYANAINTTRVSVDVNTTLRDGSPNPDVGRPVIIGPSGGSMTEETREGLRGTGYYKFNISDFVGKESIVSKILGEQTFTGVVSKQHFANFTRDFDLYNWDAQSYAGTYNNSVRYNAWWGSHYIGDSLMGVPNFNDIPASAIQGVTAIQTPGPSANAIVFDARPGPTLNTWHTANITTNSWETDLDKVYTNTSEGYDDTISKSFVWQGRLFNDALIPLFGWRQDHYTRWDKPGIRTTTARDPVTDVILPYSPDWNYTGTTPVDVTEQRRSWGWVLHTNQILDLFHYQLPKGIDLSFTYNNSNSFRPSEVGRDIMGNKLPSPSGTTRDKGFLLTVLDNKFSLRMTWYKTIQKGTPIADNGMMGWARDGMVRHINALAMEAWGPSSRTNNQTTPEWLVNKWMFGNTTTAAPIPANWQTAWSPAQLAAALAGPLPLRRSADPTDPSYIAQGTTYVPEGATAAIPYIAPPLAADEMTFRQAWFMARTDAQWFGPLDPAWTKAEGFTKAWGNDWGIWSASGIPNEKVTNDLVTKGVEIEVTANPTPNWRIAFNASRNQATRTNIAPDWADFIAKNKDIWFDGYNDTPESELSYWTVTGFADVRHWTGSTYGTDGTWTKMMGNVYGPYQNLIAQEGQSVNELRKWRWNLITNYTFSRGFLKGFNIGGGVRWQDKVAIGYYPKYNADAAIWVSDVSNPIYAPSETGYDAWLGYERKLGKRITWIVQLNAYDLFAKKTLIPILANPDGTTAQVRIPAETTVSLTNTLKF
ncbi:MAG TPA: TonB-dependent receptor plug domain-containing protein [Opitutaceae bacterium]|nr:TonB-dependent receptor plug domain-containing protein [Opitutaceae bacterium]